jgi:hypothetical protein
MKELFNKAIEQNKRYSVALELKEKELVSFRKE